MTLIDELSFDDVRLLYKVSKMRNIECAYFFMITNEKILGEDFPRHEHHKYPVVSIVKTKNGFIYDAIVGGRGFDTFGEVLYGESENSQKFIDYFDTYCKAPDLTEEYKKSVIAYNEWCDRMYIPS